MVVLVDLWGSKQKVMDIIVMTVQFLDSWDTLKPWSHYNKLLKLKHVQMFTCCAVNHTFKFLDPPEITDSFQPSRSVGRPEVLEKHWSSRTFSLFSSASFLGQSDPPPPTHPPSKDDVCWFSELQERESRPSEHHSQGGEPCSHPSWTLWRHREDK